MLFVRLFGVVVEKKLGLKLICKITINPSSEIEDSFLLDMYVKRIQNVKGIWGNKLTL